MPQYSKREEVVLAQSLLSIDSLNSYLRATYEVLLFDAIFQCCHTKKYDTHLENSISSKRFRTLSQPKSCPKSCLLYTCNLSLSFTTMF